MTMTDEPDSVDELISRYLDGEATEAEITRVESDPSLLARAESMRAAIEAVAAPVEIPVADLDRIRAVALAESGTTEQVTDLMAAGAARAERLQRRNRIMAVAAAFVLLAVGVVAVRSLPGVDSDDDASTDAATSADADADDGSDDAGDSGDDDMAAESEALATTADDDMAEEDDDMADDMAAEEEMADEDAEAAEDGGDDAMNAAAEPLPFARLDVLPDDLPAPADVDALVDSIVTAYQGEFDAENAIGLTEDELFAELCPAAIDLALGTLPFEVASIELVTTELDGAPITVIVVGGTDGSIALLTHPIDDCDAVELLRIVEPS